MKLITHGSSVIIGDLNSVIGIKFIWWYQKILNNKIRKEMDRNITKILKKYFGYDYVD
jgi:hypothetical protein